MLTDLTDQKTAAELPSNQRPRYTQTDWAGMVVAAEGPTHTVVDYEFSGRDFTHREKVLNPK